MQTDNNEIMSKKSNININTVNGNKDNVKSIKRSKLPQLISVSISPKRYTSNNFYTDHSENKRHATTPPPEPSCGHEMSQKTDSNSKSIRKCSIPIKKKISNPSTCSFNMEKIMSTTIVNNRNNLTNKELSYNCVGVSPRKSLVPNKMSRINHTSYSVTENILEKSQGKSKFEKNIGSKVNEGEGTWSDYRVNNSRIPTKSIKLSSPFSLLPNNPTTRIVGTCVVAGTTCAQTREKRVTKISSSKIPKTFYVNDTSYSEMEMNIEDKIVQRTKNSKISTPDSNSQIKKINERNSNSKDISKIKTFKRISRLPRLTSLRNKDKTFLTSKVAQRVSNFIQDVDCSNFQNDKIIIKKVSSHSDDSKLQEKQEQGQEAFDLNCVAKDISADVKCKEELEEKIISNGLEQSEKEFEFCYGETVNKILSNDTGNRLKLTERESTGIITPESIIGMECDSSELVSQGCVISKDKDKILQNSSNYLIHALIQEQPISLLLESKTHLETCFIEFDENNTDSIMQNDQLNINFESKAPLLQQTERELFNVDALQDTEEDLITFDDVESTIKIKSNCSSRQQLLHQEEEDTEMTTENWLVLNNLNAAQEKFAASKERLNDLKNIENSLKQPEVEVNSAILKAIEYSSVKLVNMTNDAEFQKFDTNLGHCNENTKLKIPKIISEHFKCSNTSNKLRNQSIGVIKAKSEPFSSELPYLNEKYSKSISKMNVSFQSSKISQPIKDFEEPNVLLNYNKPDNQNNNFVQNEFGRGYDNEMNYTFLDTSDTDTDFDTNDDNSFSSTSTPEPIEKKQSNILISSNYAQIFLPCDSSSQILDTNSDHKSLARIPQNMFDSLTEQLVSTDELIMMVNVGSHFEGHLRLENMSSSTICYKVSCFPGRYVVIPYSGVIGPTQQISLTVASARSSRSVKTELNQFKIEAAMVQNVSEVLTFYGQQLFWKEVQPRQIERTFVGSHFVFSPYESKTSLNKNYVWTSEASPNFDWNTFEKSLTKNSQNFQQGHYDILFYSTMLLSLVVTISYYFQIPIS